LKYGIGNPDVPVTRADQGDGFGNINVIGKYKQSISGVVLASIRQLIWIRI
jgi:hypothetical protein